ncbi:hypothetical protein ACP4OV_025746 [Aristida adscensionis]
MAPRRARTRKPRSEVQLVGSLAAVQRLIREQGEKRELDVEINDTIRSLADAKPMRNLLLEMVGKKRWSVQYLRLLKPLKKIDTILSKANLPLCQIIKLAEEASSGSHGDLSAGPSTVVSIGSGDHSTSAERHGHGHSTANLFVADRSRGPMDHISSGRHGRNDPNANPVVADPSPGAIDTIRSAGRHGRNHPAANPVVADPSPSAIDLVSSPGRHGRNNPNANPVVADPSPGAINTIRSAGRHGRNHPAANPVVADPSPIAVDLVSSPGRHGRSNPNANPVVADRSPGPIILGSSPGRGRRNDLRKLARKLRKAGTKLENKHLASVKDLGNRLRQVGEDLLEGKGLMEMRADLNLSKRHLNDVWNAAVGLKEIE